MTLVYTNPYFQAHDTGAHAETPRRLAAIDRQLAGSAALKHATLGAVAKATTDEITRVHTAAQVSAARTLADRGGGYLDPDTALSAASFDVALTAAGTACAAVDAVMSGAHANALCLIRPPGHHATEAQSMGFCLFNNVALAADRALRHHRAGRILIVDWDVHHGNGTQDIFYDREDVVFFSIHRFPFYPGTGAERETGTGAGLGATVNVPITFGTSRAAYMDAFRRGLESAAQRARPDLVLISAGFDAHADDPIGNLGLATEDYATMTKAVRDVANTYCGGRIVSCLEGGYDLAALAASVETHLIALEAP